MTAGGRTVAMVAKAVGGVTTSGMVDQLPAFLDTAGQRGDWVLITLGANDLPGVRDGSITEGNWRMGEMLTLLHQKWPGANLRVSKVWRDTYNVEAATWNGWIDNLVAARPYVGVGVDEGAILPAHNAGGIHPDETGYSLTASAWQTVMGF